METIHSRNQTSRTYNERVAIEIVNRIESRYCGLFGAFLQRMESLAARV